MTRKLTLSAILMISFIIFAMMFSQTSAFAQASQDQVIRQADWYKVNYGTDASGGTILIGQYGPDVGIGEQGTVYQYANPLTGQFVSYRTTDIGVGFGGPLLGYGGMFSPVAQASYGPFAYGQTPVVSPTPGFDTAGFLFGNLWGQNVNYYEARPNPFAGLLLGSFSGFGPSIAYGGLFGLGRIGLGTELDDDLYPRAFSSARGNIYGGVNLFYSDDFEEFDD
jgi:hypothetical protein